ncbi:MAG: alpha-L-fucosidase [Ilumatobacter sp.]
MTVPTWWNERRFGIFVHTTVASVPAWAPLGEYAEWYRSHLGEDVADGVLHPHTMVEVLAHHRDRWGHVERYDDFVELLTFDRFDAEEWARLASDAGAGYAVLVTKHHDGWSWWDAPGSEHRLTEHGPRRDVVGDFAAACERNDLVFGTYYSLLDWGDSRYPSADYVGVMHEQVVDLVERYGSAFLWGDGHWGHDADTWQSSALFDKIRELAPDVMLNDRWQLESSDLPDNAPPVVRTFEYDAPDDITDGAWELSRGIGQSFGHNRAELADDHLDALDIVGLFTEVVAKGGNLLLNIGPAADGTVPELQATPLRTAGAWISRHHDRLADCSPWDTWGDRDVRYFAVAPDARLNREGHDEILAVDVSGTGRFAALGASAFRVHLVERLGDAAGHTVAFDQTGDDLRVRSDVERDDIDLVDGVDVRVFRIQLEAPAATAELFATPAPVSTPLEPLLEGARAGSIVQLGEGEYIGPAIVPAGVTLRGLGPDRTHLRTSGRSPVLTLHDDAHVEHLAVIGNATRSDWSAPTAVSVPGDAAGLLGCQVRGSIAITGDDVLVRAVRAQSARATNTDRLRVSRCEFTGNRWDIGLRIRGGIGHHVESSHFDDHLCAIRITDATGTKVRGNTIAGRWWGVHAERTDDAHVHGNRVVATMRAVDLDGGSHAVVDGNAVFGGDSGCVVEGGAADCEVYGNHWDRCRVGLLAWGAVNLHHQDNVVSDLRRDGSPLITGP